MLRIFKILKLNLFLIFFLGLILSSFSQNIPAILNLKNTADDLYLPDFSFAGYHFGEKEIPLHTTKIINATDYGVIANDGLDDSIALIKALKETKDFDGTIVLQLPKGRIILSSILYIERSNFVLRGAGTGENGTEIYCPRPMMYLDDSEVLTELREYLLQFDKRQREKENNIDLPFSQYAWSGGMIWTQVPGERVKSYLEKYDAHQTILANVHEGKRGEFTLKTSIISGLKIGDVVELQLFNKTGQSSEIINDLYKKTDVNPGSHHWEFPKLPIVRQQVLITGLKGNLVTIKSPLTITIKPEYEAKLVTWKHLKEVGIEHLRITFPHAPYVAHHVERGNNAIFLTRVFNSWVNNVVINNADSGILTEEIANVTISNITTEGNNKAHYTVAMAGVHNVLVENLKVFNNADHPLSFNTFSTKNVYKNCEVYVDPVLDQHSGANHQNLFDNITVHVNPNEDRSYPLFAGGGAGYWKPSHGAYSTFWNINVQFLSGLNNSDSILLNGMQDGPFARLIAIHANHSIQINYGPEPYIELMNKKITQFPSLYDYQLSKRLK